MFIKGRIAAREYDRDRDVALAWWTERLARTDKLPPLHKLLGKEPTPTPPQPISEMKAMFGLMAGPPQEATD